ncbi:FlgE [Desulfamplus magnetovallimortis]|uniref:Flagellar hook protein FlgE n=1 Tax=Desulfamplus magnetovallimortis TaxID=1246637 RepID=A0A1W1H9Z3_9BACT|nr:flagellar hook-basal body complex protein [Desulfamplus magnetovallimortis]SLM29252.1 FlgE [Desulfamplus magnetovallimortis]
MALSSSLFTGTSGLINMGNVMQVVSNNIANSNTVGFKKGVSSFADTLNQTVSTQSGVDQIGRGMSIGEVAQSFGQGSFESTGNVTDLSIGGDGFFIVSDMDAEASFYTRAGNFHFDEAGKLVNPNGYVVQGWELDSETGDDVGAIGNIIMDTFTSPPQQSTEITAITNLDADAISKSDVMANYWDATNEDAYVGGERYEYQTVIKVYDSLGSAHDVSIYYDKKSGTEWEYMIACEPGDDKRELLQSTSAKGLLAKGTITFSESSGDIIDITMNELTGRIGNLSSSGVNDDEDIHFTIEDTETMKEDGYGFELKFDGTEWSLSHLLFDENGGNIENQVLDISTTTRRTITPGTDGIYNDLGDYSFISAGGAAPWSAGASTPALGPSGIITNTANVLEFELASGTVIRYDFDAAGAVANDALSFTLDAPTAVKNYPDATISYSDGENIYIRLNNDDQEDDVKIALDKPSDTGDVVLFDINAEKDIHVQGIDGSNFVGETKNGNTTIEVNDPSVMTIDDEGINIVWYPEEKLWRWGNPDVAAQEGNLIPEITYSGDAAFSPSPFVITPSPANPGDPSAMTKYVKDLQLAYDNVNGTWDWNMPFKSTGEDIVDEDLNLGVVDAQRTITPDATNGVFQDAGDYVITFDGPAPAGGGTNWGLTAAPAGTTINAAANNADVLEITLVSGTVIRYDFDSSVSHNDSITFTVDPSPPTVYPDAAITAGTNVNINFDGNGGDDLTIDLSGAAAAPGAGSTLILTVDPDSPPEEYQEATLTGDQKKAMIDLDGSGNEDDTDDIIFSFTKPLDITGFKDVSLIEFDISGSTAWKPIAKDDIRDTGYFSFTADFLGGDNGSTENNIKFDIGAKFDGANFQNDSMSTTQYAKASTTVFQTADGYAAGDLEGVDIATDGTITGIYSNGELIPLFRVGLAKFLNNNGLYNAGGNLFRETRDSGDAITNRPGQNGLGTLSPSSLEMSNVDISEEFVKMITTQRGFQANSKTVTTVDDMMNTVIGMKR